MSLTQNLPPPRTVAFWRDARWLDAERARVYGAILAAVQALGLLGLAVTATRGFDRNGEPLGTDFVSFWTAARLALSGAPASVYDPAAHHAAEQALLGAPIDWYAFFYPPVFLLYCLPFALLPYFVALPVWLSATAYAYWRAIRLVAAEKIGALPILAFPGVFCTLGHGQNALLSTALLGGGAALLGSRPALAGALFGALCYKPQLAVVIPLGLAVAGRWRALAAMAATVVALAGLSLALFGPEAWRAFLAEAPLARATLEQGLVEPSKMQSVFSAVRMLGGGLTVAYVAQTMTAAAACLTLIVVVRATRDALAQGVAIAAAALLVTPFLLDYDLTLMAIPLAYLLSRALTTGFLPYEKTILLVAYAFPVFARPLAQYANLPLGPIVAAALLAALARRILADDAR